MGLNGHCLKAALTCWGEPSYAVGGTGFCWSKLGAATVENEVPQKTKNGSPTLGHNIQRKHPNKKPTPVFTAAPLTVVKSGHMVIDR